MPDYPLQIHQIRLETQDIVSIELVPLEGRELASAPPGSHLDIKIPAGPSRSYSLLNSSHKPNSYRIAVKKEEKSRGGSAWFHDKSRVGQILQVSGPHNDFPLMDEAIHTVLIAGGIGITPLLPMASQLSRQGRSWELHYTARNAQSLAFDTEIKQLESISGAQVRRYLTQEGGMRLDLPSLVQSSLPSSHFYCCGPASMMDAFEQATRNLDPVQVHQERFSSSLEAASGGYTLVLARSGKKLLVNPEMSMLDTLLEAGVDVPYACTQGICGTCRVGVLEGIPDHRDECLTEEERRSDRCVIVCRSGARTPELTLDI